MFLLHAQLVEQYSKAQSDNSELASARSQLASDLEALRQQKEDELQELTANLEALSQELVHIKQVQVHRCCSRASQQLLFGMLVPSTHNIEMPCHDLCRVSLPCVAGIRPTAQSSQTCAIVDNLASCCHRLSWRRAMLARMQRSSCCKMQLLQLMRHTRR
jgi:hypothetical protein